MKLAQAILSAFLTTAMVHAASIGHELEHGQGARALHFGGGGGGGMRGGRRGGNKKGGGRKGGRCACFDVPEDEREQCVMDRIAEMCEYVTDTDDEKEQCIAEKNCDFGGDVDKETECEERRAERMARRKARCGDDADGSDP